MFIFLSIIFSATSIDFIHIKEKKAELLIVTAIIFVLLMSDHQFLFGFVFSPFLLLWKMWKIVGGREWGGDGGGEGRVEMFGRVNNRSITYRSVHEKCVYFPKTATAFTQKFWMKVKPAMFLFYQFYIATFVLWYSWH